MAQFLSVPAKIRFFEVWGREQVRDFTFVDDAVEAFLIAAARPESSGTAYNLGEPPPITLRRLAKLLVAVNGGGDYTVCEFPAARKKIDIGNYHADDRLIGRQLGWRPRASLRVALARTLEYYRRELAHYV